jgi:hypothetical protein
MAVSGTAQTSSCELPTVELDTSLKIEADWIRITWDLSGDLLDCLDRQETINVNHGMNP